MTRSEPGAETRVRSAESPTQEERKQEVEKQEGRTNRKRRRNTFLGLMTTQKVCVCVFVTDSLLSIS